jgi:hypothetical protein
MLGAEKRQPTKINRNIFSSLYGVNNPSNATNDVINVLFLDYNLFRPFYEAIIRSGFTKGRVLKTS